MSRFDRYTLDARRSLAQAREIALRLQHKTICTEHILSGLLEANDATVTGAIAGLGVNVQRLRQALEFVIGRGTRPPLVEPTLSPQAREVLDLAEQEADAEGQSEVGTDHLLLGLLREGQGIAAGVLESFGITLDRARMQLKSRARPSGNQSTFAAEHALRYSMTPTLNMVSHDLTDAALADQLDPIVGREEEITRMMQVLVRRIKNNPVLIGDAGVGKTALAEGLAQRIITGQVPDPLRNKRLVSLDVGLLTIGTKYRGDFEERLKTLVEEVLKAQNIILFIDEIQSLLGAGGAEGSIDAANLFKPILARGEFQVVGAATQDDYRKIIDRDPALERRFQPVKVREATVAESVEILRGLRPRYERFHHVQIDDGALLAAAQLANRYVQDRFLPDKAIDLIDEASARLKVSRAVKPVAVQTLREQLYAVQYDKDMAIGQREYPRASILRDREMELRNEILVREQEWESTRTQVEPTVTEKDVAEIVARWTGIPTLAVTMEESARLLNLEDDLHRRVIGQHEAVSAISRAIRRSRADLRDPKRPIGSFIFCGPTGVGKTELARALAAALFGSEDAMIKIDMSEFMEHHNAARLVGAPPGYVGYDQAGQLTESVRRKPYSVVLFDEIEKAHPKVFDLLLQILEEGRLADAKGRVVDFKNTVVILTTNAGADKLGAKGSFGFARPKSDEAEEETQYERIKAAVLPALQEMFRPEFLNRLDDIIFFHRLTRPQVREILDLMLAQTKQRLLDQVIELRVSDDAQDILAREGYNEEYGARALRRVVTTMVEDKLAEAYLQGVIAAGDTVLVDATDDGALMVRKVSETPVAVEGKAAQPAKTLAHEPEALPEGSDQLPPPDTSSEPDRPTLH